MTLHIIYISRLFSGLFESIESSCWRPTGVPTVVNLVEEISKQFELSWILVCKNKEEAAVTENKYKRLVLNNIDVHILPYRKIFYSPKLSAIFNDFLALLYCIRVSLSLKNKLFYSDVSNVVIAATLKLIFRVPVVLRIMGIKTFHRNVVSKITTKLMHPLKYCAYKAPFDLAVCTQDGSGIEFYLDKLLHRKTPRIILLNGVMKQSHHRINKLNDKVSLLFVGKLTAEKGIIELIQTAEKLKNSGCKFELNVIGKGNLLSQVEEICREKRLEENVKLIGSVSQRQIHKYYDRADIYISINKLGNFSNTVLEAMAFGKCIIMLGKDDKVHMDEFTEKVVPGNTVIRIDRNKIVPELLANLKDLCDNKEKVSIYSERMHKFANKFLWTWDERITFEIELLKKVSQGITNFE